MLQLLRYPALDRTVERASLGRFAEGFFLTRAEIASMLRHLIDAAPVRRNG